MCGRAVCTLNPQEIMARTDTNHFIGRNRLQQSFNVTAGMNQAVITNYLNLMRSQSSNNNNNNNNSNNISNSNNNDCEIDLDNLTCHPCNDNEINQFISNVYQEGVVVNRADRVAMTMNWGGIGDPQYNIINIRSDNIPNVPLFKHLLKKQRCLIVADGFYEWKHNSSETSSKIPPSPYYFYPANNDLYNDLLSQNNNSSDNSCSSQNSTQNSNDSSIRSDNNNQKDNNNKKTMILMAGIYQVKKSATGTDIYKYALITCDAYKDMAGIHHRMPVILTNKEDIELWLRPYYDEKSSTKDVIDAYKLLNPYDGLSFHKVPVLVNNIRFNSPDCIKPEKEYYSKSGIDRFFQVKTKEESEDECSIPLSFDNDGGDTSETSTQTDNFLGDDTSTPSSISSSSSNISSTSVSSSTSSLSTTSSALSSKSTTYTSTNTPTNTPTSTPTNTPTKSKKTTTTKNNKKNNNSKTLNGGGIERFFDVKPKNSQDNDSSSSTTASTTTSTSTSSKNSKKPQMNPFFVKIS